MRRNLNCERSHHMHVWDHHIKSHRYIKLLHYVNSHGLRRPVNGLLTIQDRKAEYLFNSPPSTTSDHFNTNNSHDFLLINEVLFTFLIDKEQQTEAWNFKYPISNIKWLYRIKLHELHLCNNGLSEYVKTRQKYFTSNHIDITTQNHIITTVYPTSIRCKSQHYIHISTMTFWQSPQQSVL